MVMEDKLKDELRELLLKGCALQFLDKGGNPKEVQVDEKDMDAIVEKVWQWMEIDPTNVVKVIPLNKEVPHDLKVAHAKAKGYIFYQGSE